MKKQFLMLAIASSCLFATQAGAMTKEEHKAAMDKINAEQKADGTRCNAMKDNAKDICEKEAKGKEKVAKAELEQAYKPSAKNARKVEEEKVDAMFMVAKEKCDDMKGDGKDACQKEARAAEKKGKADVKAMKM